jgi:hypothetical protein
MWDIENTMFFLSICIPLIGVHVSIMPLCFQFFVVAVRFRYYFSCSKSVLKIFKIFWFTDHWTAVGFPRISALSVAHCTFQIVHLVFYTALPWSELTCYGSAWLGGRSAYSSTRVHGCKESTSLYFANVIITVSVCCSYECNTEDGCGKASVHIITCLWLRD